MKLEEGMYVRTKDGDVFILDKIEDNHLIPRYVYIPYIIIEADVKKTSHNIIDLIEVGDYVNGYIVDQIDDFSNSYKCVYVDRDNNMGFRNIDFKEEDIKTIVTKEQFESMSYKVGE